MGLNIIYLDGESPLSEEEKEGLLIKTISNRAELDEFEQRNIETAVEWALNFNFFDGEAEKIMTEKFIKDLHRRMFGQVWAWAGKFRLSNKNIGVDKGLIGVEIKKLNEDCLYWLTNNSFSSEEIAIRFKHRLVSIHPFANGNGRHARLMADIIMEKIFKGEAFSWGGVSLSNASKSRTRYIQAVRKADHGDYGPLLNFARS